MRVGNADDAIPRASNPVLLFLRAGETARLIGTPASLLS